MSIAIIIPAYNASAFIAETLESALRQTLPADDILVVDDGSTDNTAAIAEGFPSPVRVLTISNSKLGAARNFGVSQVETEWIAFLDADDLWTTDKLELQMQKVEMNPGADVCYTGHMAFSENLGVQTFQEAIAGCPSKDIAWKLLEESGFLPSSALIRRSALTEVGGFSPDPGVSEDWDLWLRLLHAGKQFAGCPEPLVLYRIHPNSITSDKVKQCIKNLRIYREQIIPYLTGREKRAAVKRFSSQIADTAYLMRELNDARYLRMMTSSILQWPFGDLNRYKVWAHMLYTRLKTISAPNA